MGKDAWLHLPVKVMLYLARGWAVHMGSAPSGWPATLPSEARRKAQRAEWGLDWSFQLLCILSGKKTCVGGEGGRDMAVGWE